MDLVALVAVLPNPVGKGLSHEGVDDVADVLAGHLADFLHDG